MRRSCKEEVSILTEHRSNQGVGVRSSILLLAMASAICSAADAAPEPPRAVPSPPQPAKVVKSGYKVTEIAKGLDHPWSMAFLPDGSMLVTERAGRLRLIQGGLLRPEPIG